MGLLRIELINMGRFTSMFNGLAKSLGLKSSGDDSENDTAEAMAKDAKKNDMMLRCSGTMNVHTLVSVCSKRGEKGVNQDCCIVWEEFGCQKDMMFCGIFDGHGPWGHYDLQHSRKFDSFHSGTTALAVVRQGELLVIANVGDSRAVLAMTSEDGCLVPIQLTVDFKPIVPYEAKRILECKGRVFCMEDEPGVHRLWLPNEDSPGLAMSRAFGDYYVKDFGLISVPEVTQRLITSKDQFLVLASDGVWDVISNQEAVEIVSSTVDKSNLVLLLDIVRVLLPQRWKSSLILVGDSAAVIHAYSLSFKWCIKAFDPVYVVVGFVVLKMCLIHAD
ncbi:hypothetical protein L1987_54722 [Smallanthus sonchifolius]|uniref:Uncharacterized protein n=1 Tax=Smallanthus sonchifolius TaxID=185202 RepID=A0ACB9E8B2_9ASTR|nr:hypothetical protein L1987_54722 [Smallanthus sonchifolius]